MLAKSRRNLMMAGLLGAIGALMIIGLWIIESPLQAQGVDADGDGNVDGSPAEQRTDIPMANPAAAGSGTLLGVSFDLTDSPVVTINEGTGMGALVGPAGFPKLNAMSRDSSGTFYSAVDDPFTGASQDLITINPTNGVGTSVATLNFGQVTPDVRGLAFSQNDVLFALNNTGPAGGLNPDDLYRINAGTGTGALVGATGLTDLQGLAFSSTGTLYGWDITIGLVTINPLTGMATDVNPNVNGIGGIQGIAFAQDGKLYGARDSLYEINPATGQFSLIGSGGYSDVRGIAEVPPEPEEEDILSFSVKFVCGRQTRGGAREWETVRPGLYATEINIHNYKDVEVPIVKYVIPLVKDGEAVGREPEFVGIEGQDGITLPPNTATMDDCYRIGELLYGSPPPVPLPLTIGFLEIISREDLNVDAVYTVSDIRRTYNSNGGVVATTTINTSIEVERIEGKYK